ncbi:two-partner secretion domain-containing protein [Magnetospirillum gryphiswaldense]|uniref:Hemagglutinin-related protein n=1 Tax=Magnetospirillum gryphiswaldense TaxID=55518 RepID=A4U4Q4_9PROT|nr:filamentous hemagglutinin N-terminal domain-containing protein [Magnetospirillum gryphiswaldense]AVM72686.1 Heme/hemopexin-binding protein precursor [Magnetospirillum gryphiswaldense MSR-1]AVM76589.1 Heme/hemopexin-binding protein precursor [Magnetospirillum gryphiswaldense]CAM77861.1 hemagglutinin-related protein, fragment [Magnetospirillum gryphiswaldense MSR-1]
MIRRPSMRRWLVSTTALAGVLTIGAPAALANPQGGTVAQGSATITQTDPKTLTINQTSDRAVLNWQSFSIGAGETTRFIQPSSSSSVLNRVTGDQVSQILGSLQANGRVYLVNPNGIVFGAGSKIDVAALVASTANIKDSNFMAGNLRFDIPGKPNAQIINQGTITAADGGLVALVAPSLRNAGIISARLGKIALAGANGVTLDLYGDNLIAFQADDKITGQLVGPDGQPVAAQITNDGKIMADGGWVLLSANIAKGVVDNAINTTGLISARAVEQQGGEIVLKGEDAGIVQVSGTLDASGKEAGQKGGTVNVLGEKVGLVSSASVDVSGDAGGGAALIGGDYQGKGTVRNAQVTYMGQDATINASALRIGNGGKAILWADGTTRSYGRIFAQGGINGGDGGFVETSGKGFLDQTGTVNTLAPKGTTGTWLLDPQNIIIATGGGQTLDGTNSSLFADNSGGTSTIAPSVINSATSNVTLQASQDITVSNAVSMTNSGKAFIAQAGRNIFVNAGISTSGGDIQLLSGYDVTTGNAASNAGAIRISGASIGAGTGNVTIKGRGETNITDSYGGQSGVVLLNGTQIVTTSGNINLTGFGAGGGGVGVYLGESGISSTDGDVRITGSGGTGCCWGHGIIVGNPYAGTGKSISVDGSGSLILQGTAGSAWRWNYGVLLFGNALISHTGDLGTGKTYLISGTGSGASDHSRGVSFEGNSTVTTKNAPLNISGSSSSAGIDSFGIAIASGLDRIYMSSTGSGQINLAGTPSGTAGRFKAGISLGDAGGGQYYIQSAGAAVRLYTDTLYVHEQTTYGQFVNGVTPTVLPRANYVQQNGQGTTGG